jgi:hypothetical protein
MPGSFFYVLWLQGSMCGAAKSYVEPDLAVGCWELPGIRNFVLSNLGVHD